MFALLRRASVVAVCAVLSTLCLAGTATAGPAAANYTFTTITSGPLPSLCLDDNGNVYFGGSGLYVGNGGAVTKLPPTLTSVLNPTVNAAGEVFFDAYTSSGWGLYRYYNGVTSPSLSNWSVLGSDVNRMSPSGNAVFFINSDTACRYMNGVVTKFVKAEDGLIADDGAITIVGSGAQGSGIYRITDTSTQLLFSQSRIPSSGLDRLATDGHGDLIFSTWGYPDGAGLYRLKSDGTCQAIATFPNSPGVALVPGMNSAGDIAFWVENSDFKVQIWVAKHGQAPQMLLSAGESFMGSKIYNLRFNPNGLNSSGQLAFGVELTDGRQYTLRADPVPEPSSILALLCGTAGIGGTMWLRKVPRS